MRASVKLMDASSASCSIRDRLSRSEMMALSRSACLWMMDRNRCASSRSSGGFSCSVSTKPLMLVMGVRSSCETLATKSRRMFSRRRNRVTSLSTSSAPRRSPRGPCRPVACTCRYVSFSRLRTMSPSTGPSPRSASSVSSRRSGLRTTSCTLRPSACSGASPSRRAPARFRPSTVSSVSMASTPSTMELSTASSSLRCFSTVAMRSCSCAAMRFMASASAPISSLSGASRRTSRSPSANRTAPACRRRSGTLIRREM